MEAPYLGQLPAYWHLLFGAAKSYFLRDKPLSRKAGEMLCVHSLCVSQFGMWQAEQYSTSKVENQRAIRFSKSLPPQRATTASLPAVAPNRKVSQRSPKAASCRRRTKPGEKKIESFGLQCKASLGHSAWAVVSMGTSAARTFLEKAVEPNK